MRSIRSGIKYESYLLFSFIFGCYSCISKILLVIKKMGLHTTIISTETVLIAAFITGISLVISNVWGEAISGTVKDVSARLRCGKPDGTSKYTDCANRNTISTLYISAAITTIFLAFAVFLIVVAKNHFLGDQKANVKIGKA